MKETIVDIIFDIVNMLLIVGIIVLAVLGIWFKSRKDLTEHYSIIRSDTDLRWVARQKNVLGLNNNNENYTFYSANCLVPLTKTLSSSGFILSDNKLKVSSSYSPSIKRPGLPDYYPDTNYNYENPIIYYASVAEGRGVCCFEKTRHPGIFTGDSKIIYSQLALNEKCKTIDSMPTTPSQFMQHMIDENGKCIEYKQCSGIEQFTEDTDGKTLYFCEYNDGHPSEVIDCVGKVNMNSGQGCSIALWSPKPN